MIPHCLAIYGTEAEKWFSTTGLLVYKDVKWDDQTGKTSSKCSKETEDLVNENDIFGMGDIWKQQIHTQNNTFTRPGEKIPITTPNLPQRDSSTMNLIIQSRANNKDVESLGSVYQCNKDDDTVATNATAMESRYRSSSALKRGKSSRRENLA